MNLENSINRRKALKITGAGTLALSLGVRADEKKSTTATPAKLLNIGLVADVHQDVMHDGYARIKDFIDTMQERKPDMLLQLGDFAVPRKLNQAFLDKWNEFKGPKYHVLGNHDMDHGFTKQQTMDWWSMKERYYSLDMHGWHFVILDGNKNDAPGKSEIDDEQHAWLKQDLAATSLRTVIFSHQSLEARGGGVRNREAIRTTLEKANKEAGFRKVIACLSGHHHTDYLKEINGIPYIQINSMSYNLNGGPKKGSRYPQHIEKAYPRIRLVSPYKEPIYTMLTLDPDKKVLSIEESTTDYVAPVPEHLIRPDKTYPKPRISARSVDIS